MLGPDRPRFSAPASAAPAELTPEQSLLVRQFNAQVGGLENARRALELLALFSRPADGRAGGSPR
jgi:hypothetical protein